MVDPQAGDQKAEELHPVQQKGIAQVATGQWAEGPAQGRQLGSTAQKFQAGAAAKGEGTAQAGPQGQERQGAGGAAEGLDRLQKAMPFVRHRRSPQVPQHRLEGLHPHPDPQPALRQQQIPMVIGHHRHRFPHRPQHLGQGIGRGPATESTPEGWSRLELKAPPTEAVGSASWNAVGLQHLHRQAMAGGDSGGTEPPKAGADHDQVGIGGAPPRSCFGAHRGRERSEPANPAGAATPAAAP